MRAFELKSAVHDVFNHVWSSLVQVNVEKGEITIQHTQQGARRKLFTISAY